MTTYTVFIGAYSARTVAGLHVYRFDEASEELTPLVAADGLKDPSFLCLSPEAGVVYSFNQAQEGEEAAEAVAFRHDPATGRLERFSSAPLSSRSATHIQTDRFGELLLAVSYGHGTVSILPLEKDGSIGQPLQTIVHEGSSVIPKVQESPHPHSIFPDPSNRFALVADLGTDKVIVYRIDRENKRLAPHGEAVVAAGSGPRHLAFHPELPYVYLINEHSSTVTVFAWNGNEGILSTLQTISTLPEGYDGVKNACAEIQVSPCGRFVYGSNRGPDNLVVYAVNPANGSLTLVEHVPTMGGHPRHFSLSPSGRHLFAANRDSDSVTVFRVDPESGRLTPLHRSIPLHQPTCIRFL